MENTKIQNLNIMKVMEAYMGPFNNLNQKEYSSW